MIRDPLETSRSLLKTVTCIAFLVAIYCSVKNLLDKPKGINVYYKEGESEMPSVTLCPYFVDVPENNEHPLVFKGDNWTMQTFWERVPSLKQTVITAELSMTSDYSLE